jgi:hypothetical protein
MKKYSNRYNLLVILIVIFLFGCEREVMVDIPTQETKLVVNSISNRDSTFSPLIERFELGKSRNILEPIEANSQTLRESLFAKDGIFYLYANDVLFDTLIYDNALGYYPRRHFFPGIIKKYTIKGGAPGFSPIEASTVIPAYIPVKVVGYKPNFRKRIDGTNVDEVIIQINDPINEKNFYGLYFRKATSNNAWLPVYCFSSKDQDIDEIREQFNPFNIEPCLQSAYFTDINFNGTEKQIKLEVPSADMQPYTDIQTGVVTRPLVRIEHITEDYYRYIRSRNKNISIQGNPFAEPVSVYSNIKNGYGIFTFYTSAQQEIK